MQQPVPRARVASPWHPGFINAGGTLLIAAFVTDLTYYRTSTWQWANFSAWLIAGGLVMALVAAIVLVLDLVLRRVRGLDGISFAIVAAAALLSVVNVFVHSRDSWTSVVPDGLVLSGVVTVLLLIVAARGWRVTPVQAALQGDRA